MSKFKKVAKHDLFNLIILHVAVSCEKMKNDCNESQKYLANHEDKISNRLVAQYFDKNSLELIFILQKPENFNAESDTFAGRTDISVMSSDTLKNRSAYLTIECKRLDGGKTLNKKYVKEGITRFVEHPPRYSSYYGKSIMLGYIVKAINGISENTKKIDDIQRELLAGVQISEMQFVSDDGKGFTRYHCTYQGKDIIDVELAHLFYDFSSVVDKKDS